MERLKGLDGVRGLLALIVASSHSFSHFTGWGVGFNIVRNSTFAVDIFFILSGMVLYYSHKQNITLTSFGILQFIKTRFFRLYPLHFFAMILIPLCLYVSGGSLLPEWIGAFSFSRIIIDLLLLGNFGHLTPFLNPPTWSIASEFYVASFIVVLCCYRPYFSYFFFLLSVLLIVPIGMRPNEIHSAHYLLLSGGALRCMLCVSTGIIVMHALEFNRAKSYIQKYSSWIIGIASIITILSITGFIPAAPVYIVSIFIISFGLAALTQSSGPFVSLLESRSFVFLGKNSYSIYLMHTPIIYLFLYFKNSDLNHNIVFACFAVVSTVIVSSLTYRVIEKPFICFGKQH